MKIVKWAVAIGCLIAAPAQAQMSTCSWVGNTWTCNQFNPATINPGIIQPPPQVPVPNFVEMYARGQQLKEEREARRSERRAYEIETDRQRAERGLQLGVGKLLKLGKCTEAVDMALEAGNLDLANQAQQFCDGKR